MLKLATVAGVVLATSVSAQVPSGVWVNTSAGNSLHRIGENGTVTNYAQSGAAEGIAVGADGRIYSVSASEDALQIYASDGSSLGSFATADEPFGIAMSATHAWVSCRSGSLQRFELDGSNRATFATDLGARDVAVDSVGSVWVASREQDQVIRYDQSGAEQARVVVGDGPTYLEATPYGELLAMCYHNCTLYKLCITTDQVLASAGVNGFPGDLTIDGFGRTWIALEGRSRVHVFDRMLGNPVEIATGSSPRGVSVDFDNVIWVACAGNNRMYRYNANGTPLGHISLSGTPRATGDMSGVAALIHAVPLGDADADGHLNRAEWVSCSDLLDAADVPIELTAVRNGLGVDLWVRENHHAANFYFFYLTTQPLPGTNIGQFQHGVDPRILQANIGELLFWNSILVPYPGLLDGFSGVTSASGEAIGRANFPDPIPGLFVGAFTMDFDTPPSLSYVRSLSIAVPLN